MLVLANPWGLLALTGLLAVVAIHLLRRRSRRVAVSTLFLVEQALPSSEGGKKLRRLRNSWPLWWQLLAIIALSLLLAQPRWQDLVPTQTVVVVLDSSASMSAIRDHALQETSRLLHQQAAQAEHTEWTVLGSDSARLGAGRDLASVLAQVGQSWQPILRTHDTREAFRLARSLAGAKGSVIFLTDHPAAEDKTQPQLQWVAVGQPIENVGFLGGTANEDRWQALVKNFGTTQRTTRWRVQGAADWHSASLTAGQMLTLEGGFPLGTDKVFLELEADQFPLDDSLPIIREKSKNLVVRESDDPAFRSLLDQVVSMAEPFTVSGTPDVSLQVYDPLSPKAVPGAAVLFVADASKAQKPLTGLIVAESDPLMENLAWQGLIAHDNFVVPAQPGDEVLLWQGSRPLIFKRGGLNAPQLVFNFDVRQSNATRLPAFPLLLHRFFAQVRAGKVALEIRNVETGQALLVAGAGKQTAPELPGFFTVKDQTEQPLFEGAAQFSDPRESDFRQAASLAPPAAEGELTTQATLRGELIDPLLALVLLGFFLANWWATGRPARS